jgi:hypothetical protein
MWSDMFFRLANEGRYYVEDARLTPEVMKQVPEEVALCYWDYGEHKICEEIFDSMFQAHEKFNREIWFAGGVWNWNGFAPSNRLGLHSMEPAFKQVRKHKIKNVLVTVWGDDGNDTSYFVTLPSLYAVKQYAEGNFDEEKIAKGFREMFGVDFYDFMLLDIPNKNSGNPECKRRECACKTLLYTDCFLGWKDNALAQLEPIPYGDYARQLWEAGERAGEYKFLFDNLARLCYALDKKAYLGLRTRKAYREEDKEELKKLVEDYEEAAKRIEEFAKGFRQIWLNEFKPFGWEIQQIRLGGLVARVRDCKERLIEYLEGKADNIPELEADILPYGDIGLQYNCYHGLVSVSGL